MLQDRTINMLDLNPEHEVEIVLGYNPVHELTVWINVDGICRLRASSIPRLVLEDNRELKLEDK